MTNEPQNPQDSSVSESVTSSVTTATVGGDGQNPSQGQTITRDTEVKDGKVVKDETHKS